MTSSPPPLRYPGGLTRPQVTAWRNALFLVFALCGIGIASWMARTPLMKQALGVSTADMGILLLAIAIGSICGLLASSHLLAAFGAKRVMGWCLAIGPLGLVAAGLGITFAHSFWIAFAGLFVFGIGMATCDVGMNLSGAVNERVLGRTIMPIYHAFFSFGTMVGAGLGALAEAAQVSLALQAIVVSAAIIVAGIFGVRSIQSEHVIDQDAAADAAANGVEPERASTWRDRVSIWRDPRTLTIGVIVLGMALAEGSANDWLALTMVEGHNVDRPTGAVIFGVFVTAMTVGRLSGVLLLDRFGRVPVLRGSAILAIIGLLLVIYVPVVWIAIVGVVLWGLGASLGFPTGMSAAADDPKTAAARVSAVATIGYVAFLVGPPAIGFLGEHFGLLNALLPVLLLIVAAAIASPAAREPGVPVTEEAASR